MRRRDEIQQDRFGIAKVDAMAAIVRYSTTRFVQAFPSYLPWWNQVVAPVLNDWDSAKSGYRPSQTRVSESDLHDFTTRLFDVIHQARAIGMHPEDFQPPPDTVVGIFGLKSPVEVKQELETVNTEISQFAQEVRFFERDTAAQLNKDPEVVRLHAAEDAARQEWERAKADVAAHPASAVNPWLKKATTPEETRRINTIASTAQANYDAASKKYNDARDAARTYFELQMSKVAAWLHTSWTPFFEAWKTFYDHKMNVPAQTWPGTGTWDEVQDYRQKLIDLRKGAPFTVTSPSPVDPASRREAGIGDAFTSIFGSIGSVAKVVVYGGLGLIGLIAITSLVSHARRGTDPAEAYMKLARSRARAA